MERVRYLTHATDVLLQKLDRARNNPKEVVVYTNYHAKTGEFVQLTKLNSNGLHEMGFGVSDDVTRHFIANSTPEEATAKISRITASLKDLYKVNATNSLKSSVLDELKIYVTNIDTKHKVLLFSVEFIDGNTTQAMLPRVLLEIEHIRTTFVKLLTLDGK